MFHSPSIDERDLSVEDLVNLTTLDNKPPTGAVSLQSFIEMARQIGYNITPDEGAEIWADLIGETAGNAGEAYRVVSERKRLLGGIVAELESRMGGEIEQTS